MIAKNTPAIGNQSFEDLKQSNDHGAEFWSARDLQPVLGYSQRRRFEDAINRAITSCERSGNNAWHHFAGTGKPITGGKGAVQTVDDYQLSEGGEIDIDDAGKMTARFIADLQRDLGFAYRPENWDEVKLAAWLCRNLPEPSLTHASKQAFVAHWINDFLEHPTYDLGRANRQKLLIRLLLERRIKELRTAAVKQAYQQTLFGDGRETRVAVDDRYSFEFHPQGYAPSRDYDGRFGQFAFRKHYYGRVGDFDSGEEFACACWLDVQAQQGRINFWVRNLVRKEGCSFFLQKTDGRFYPDFLCQLPDGVILAVEYKGADRWKEAEDDRLIGGLWAELSGGLCRFVMVKDKKWEGIAAEL